MRRIRGAGVAGRGAPATPLLSKVEDVREEPAALPLLERVSGCVKQGRLPPPGRFGMEWGRATPWAVLAGYVAYGAVMGGVLVAF